MVPSLSLSPDQITKPPSANPISPPHSSELLRRNLTLDSLLMRDAFGCRSSYRDHEGLYRYSVIASEAKQSIVTGRTESMDCFVAVVPRNDGDGCRMQPASPEALIRLLRQSEPVDHLALGFGHFDDELLVVFRALVVRHHVEF